MFVTRATGPIACSVARTSPKTEGFASTKLSDFIRNANPISTESAAGDILLTARGQRHRAYHIDRDLSNVLAAATFYILRSDTNRIRPGYLAWWLNLPRIQSEIDSASGGTYISHIRRGALEGLMVSVPPLEVQHGIERVVLLWRQRNALRVRIDRKREKYIRAVCQKAVQKS